MEQTLPERPMAPRERPVSSARWDKHKEIQATHGGKIVLGEKKLRYETGLKMASGWGKRTEARQWKT